MGYWTGSTEGVHMSENVQTVFHRELTERQLVVLQAVAEDRIERGFVLGTLEPHLLDDRDVIWTLRALVIKGLVRLQPIGSPLLTDRGWMSLRVAA